MLFKITASEHNLAGAEGSNLRCGKWSTWPQASDLQNWEPALPRSRCFRGGAGRDSAKAATPAPQDLCMILKLVDCDGYHELDYGYYGRLT
jgi:hypothetical protein